MPMVGCKRCGWCVHISHAKETNFCPRCGNNVSFGIDSRDFDDGNRDRDWKEYQRLKNKFENHGA